MSWTIEEDTVRQSKWTVLALGEAQLDGGVGGQMNDSAFTDRTAPANPDGPDFADNANNTFEQENALKNWVDMAVDMLNRGANEQDVLSKLGHDGCPDPEQVLQLAMSQPEQEFQDDQAGQDAFAGAPPAIEAPQSMGDSNSQLPMGVAASVEYTDVWGQKLAMPEPEQKPEVDPVSEIQAFIDSFPDPDAAQPASVLARIDNLKQARKAIRYVGANSRLNWVQASHLADIDMDTQAELLHLSAAVGDLAFQTHDDFLQSQRESGFRVNAFGFEGDPNMVEEELRPEPYNPNRMDEDAEIIAAEHAEGGPEAVIAAAVKFITSKTSDEKVQNYFIWKAHEYEAKYIPKTSQSKTAAIEEDADGPAEALFM